MTGKSMMYFITKCDAVNCKIPGNVRWIFISVTITESLKLCETWIMVLRIGFPTKSRQVGDILGKMPKMSKNYEEVKLIFHVVGDPPVPLLGKTLLLYLKLYRISVPRNCKREISNWSMISMRSKLIKTRCKRKEKSGRVYGNNLNWKY